MKKISVIAPLYNEEGIVEELVTRLRNATRELPFLFEFIVVDDGSSDSTLQKLLSLVEVEPRLRVIKLSRNWGQQNAFNAGLDHASGDAVILMDGDLEDPPELIPEFIAKWQQGFDVIYAVKKTRQETVFKKFMFSLFYRLLDRISEVSVEKQTGMFSLLDARAVRVLKQCTEKNKYYVGLRAFVGFRQTPLYYDREKRFAGPPKQTFRRLMNYALNAFFSFSFLPIRMLTYFGVFLIIAMVCVSAVLIGLKVFGSHLSFYRDMPGWTSIVLLIFFVLGIQTTFLGILGEYIARIFDEVRNRPYYVVEQVFEQDADRN